DRGQRLSWRGGSISGGIDAWVRWRLQPSRNLHATVLGFDTGSRKVKMVDVRHPTCTVNDEIGFDGMVLPGLAVEHAVRPIRIPNPLHFGLSHDLNPGFAAPFEQHLYEVGVKHLQLACAAVEDCHLSSRPRSDMGEFEGDVAATDKDDPARQFGEV